MFERHGLTKTSLYGRWANMKSRCDNENHPDWSDYGGRGIFVCQEWSDSFEAFYKWAIENGYDKNLSIDRIDNDGIYEPANCRWATRFQQMQNTRTPRRRDILDVPRGGSDGN